MDPLTDFDRALREALKVEPSGDFTARVRAHVAEPPRQSWGLMPRLACAAVACAALVVVATSQWREPEPATESRLRHRDLMVLAGPARVAPSPPPPQHQQRRATAPFNATEVMVSRSEMLALQRLFSGITVAPPALQPRAEELSIPELAIAPLSPVSPEGER
jgi:hypothetical protein